MRRTKIVTPGFRTVHMFTTAEISERVALLFTVVLELVSETRHQVRAAHVVDAEFIRMEAGELAGGAGALVLNTEVAAAGGDPVRAVGDAALVLEADRAELGATEGAFLGAAQPEGAKMSIAACPRRVNRVVVHPIRAARRLAHPVHSAEIVRVQGIVRLALHWKYAPGCMATVVAASIRPILPLCFASCLFTAVVFAIIRV